MTSEEEGRREGERGKQEGMDRGERHADPYWKRCAFEAGKKAAERKPLINMDDVARIMEIDYPEAHTHDDRAYGGIMRSLAGMDYIVAIDSWKKSTRSQNHRRPIQTWFSLIYKGPLPIKRPRPRRIPDPRQLSMELWQ